MVSTLTTKKYLLKGLHCANCAAKIENAIKAMDGIASASVNFLTTTLHIEANEEFFDNIEGRINDIVHKYEPDVLVIEHDGKKGNTNKSNEHGDCCGHSHNHNHEESGKKDLIKLFTGIVIFGCGLIVSIFTDINEYIPIAAYVISYLILGGEIVLRAAKNLIRGKVFDENFLMSIATIGAFIIGEYPEAVAVMLFFQVGEYFQSIAVRKSKKSISSLMDIRPDYANILNNGDIIKVDPDTVNIGDIIVVKPGEKIPLDGVVIEGESMLDTTALTGESVPRKAAFSDTVLSGCINLNGVLTVEVTKTFGESTVAKIIDLVENAGSKKAPAEKFITKFAQYYTPVVVGLALLLAVIPPLFFGGTWVEWVHRALVFLVISCPCALVVSIPLSFFGGIGGAAKKGVLVKGGNYLEALNNLDIVVFDKTGTLTKGVFKVTSIQPSNGFTENELLSFAASAEALSNHPIALSIQKAFGGETDKDALSEYNEIAGHGVCVKHTEKTILAGNGKLMNLNNIIFVEAESIGTTVYIAVDHMFAGYIIISDEIKTDSYKAITELKAKGVRKTVMLSGDNPQIAGMIAEELKLDEVHAGLLPHEKVEKVEYLNGQKQSKGTLAFVGDGINDAPVLARADIGIAMGALGSDAAIEAADIVLMTDEPSKLSEAIDIARFTRRIVWQNIVFALGVKGLFLVLGAFGVASLWEAVFADVGVSLLAVLNATRVGKLKA
ncbi:MAG: cadmium-translocating P-type ATPase [Defluviitaleaceae bacterium]|nr:cadmium-translocating P-type ATPase [Defluviitaleaceae bacterium]